MLPEESFVFNKITHNGMKHRQWKLTESLLSSSLLEKK